MHLSVNRRTALVILAWRRRSACSRRCRRSTTSRSSPSATQPFNVLLALNLTYWYAWALLAPFMLWMARRFRFERDGWLRAVSAHVGGVLVATFAHAMRVGDRARLHPALDGGPRGRVVAGRPRALLPLLRLGDDDLLGRHRRQPRAGLPPRVAGARASRRPSSQTRLAEAQLQALQRQLHPHFLFNTLHTISALMHRDIEAADAMLARLSDLLRLTLDQVGTQVVPLKDELDFVEKYLEIERTRFGDRLQVRIDAEPGTLDASVPNFVLQPLVENALRHGIGPKVGGGTRG